MQTAVRKQAVWGMKAMRIMIALISCLICLLFAVAYSVAATSLNIGEVYSSSDGKRAIEVISENELEIGAIHFAGLVVLAGYEPASSISHRWGRLPEDHARI